VDDPIVDEVRRIRREHAAEFNFDVDAIYEDYRRLELESKQRRVLLGPRRLEETTPASLPVPVIAIK
jgi:hypothetical protein